MRAVKTETPLAEELRGCQAQIERIETELSTVTEGLTDAQLTWRPAEGSWSMRDCISHLNLFGDQVDENVRAMIQEARSKGLYSNGPYHHGMLGNLLIHSVEPPYRMRFKAVRRLIPTNPETAGQVIQSFRALQGRLRTLLTDANGLDLGGVTRRLPPTYLALTLGQWLAICLAHERRHLWQASQIRRHAGFPQ